MPESIPLDEFDALMGNPSAIPPMASRAQPESIPLDEFDALMSQPEPEGGVFSRAYDAVKGAIVGDAEFDYPELGSADPEETEIGGMDSLKIATGFFLEPSTEGKAGIIKKYVPDATFGRDKNDNLYTVLNNKRYYINKPGASPQDFVDLAGEIVKFLPGVKAAGAATKGSSLITQALGQSLAAGGTSLASDELAQGFGSSKKTDLGDAGIVATVAGVATVLSPLAAAAYRKVTGGSKLTQQEIKELSNAGISLRDLKKVQIKEIKSGGANTTAERIRAVEGQMTPKPIPQSAADIAQSTSLRRLEAQAARGELGEGVKGMAKEFAKRQQQAIDDNVQILRTMVSKGKPASAAEQGAYLQNKLVRMREATNDAVSQAYTNALSKRAFIPGNSLDLLERRVSGKLLFQSRQAIERGGLVDKQFDYIQNLKNQFRTGDNRLRAEILEEARKSVNANLFNQATNKAERDAAKFFRNEIDNLMDDFIQGGLMSGDESAVKAIRSARAASAAFKDAFERNDIIKTLTVNLKGDFGKEARLAIDPDDAISVIFSKNSISRKGVLRDVKKLRKILPEDDFARVSEAGLQKVFAKGMRNDGFSAQTARTEWRKLLSNNPKLIDELYAPDQKKAISDFLRIAARIQDKSDVASPALKRMGQNAGTTLVRMFGRTGDLAHSLLFENPIVSPIAQGARQGAAKRALQGQVPITSESVLLPAGAEGAGSTLIKGER